MKHIRVAKEVFVSPARLAVSLVVVILFIDFGLELLESLLNLQHSPLTAVIDGFFLILLLTPALYWLLFRPMAKYIGAIKTADENLRKEKEFSENLVQIANIILVGLDREGNVTLLSKSAEMLLGYAQEELKGQNWFETVVPKTKYPQAYQTFQQARQGVLTKNVEQPILTKSGAERIIAWQNGFVFENEQIVGSISFGVDITDRKRAELEMRIHAEIDKGYLHTSSLDDLLRLVHQALKKVMYAENCFFTFYDPKTGLFSFPYFADQFDTVPPPSPLEKSCTAYVFRSGNSIIMTQEVFRHLSEQGEIELIGAPAPSWIGIPLQVVSNRIGVMVLQHYDQESVYSDKDLVFLESIANHVAKFLERRRNEEELEKSNSLLTASLESTADGILVVDKDGKVAGFNNKFIELWRITKTVIDSKDDKILLSFVLDQLADPQGFINKVNELYLNEEETCLDFVHFKDGRIFERYTQAQTIQGKSVGRVWSFRDVTDKIKFVDELRIKEANLRELNATKDKFFSIIAHDLRSPFNSIMGFSEILTEQIRQKDYEGILEYAEIIHNSSKNAMDLLINLMEWSRAQSGRMDFNPENVEISSFINEVVEHTHVAALKKSIQLTSEHPHHLLAFIDRDMISSVLRNLISNSIKFSYPGSNIQIKAEQTGEELKISVIDNGIGMSSDNLNKLFRMDESYSIRGTQNERGTGLGLLLCKEFVQMHGGAIWAESELGKGSRFNFTIPVKKQSPINH